jgi:hypothetical protein
MKTFAQLVSVLFVAGSALLATLATQTAGAQSVAWTQRFNGMAVPTTDTRCIDFASRPRLSAVDSRGDIFVIACGEVGDDRKPMLTYKIDGSSGTVLWAATYLGANKTFVGAPTALAVNQNGDVIVTGAGTDDAGNMRMRTIKYSGATGAEQWNVSYAGSPNGNDFALALALDINGNPFISGYSTDAVGGKNIRTIMYDGANGNERWNSSYSGSALGDDLAYAIAVDRNSNAVVTGYSTDAAGGKNIRTIKYRGDTGAEVWNVSFDGASGADDVGNAVTMDATGNVFVTGQTDTGTNRRNYITFKYAAGNGAVLWQKEYDNASSDDVSWAIALDTTGNAFVTGTSVDFATDGSVRGNTRTIKYDGVNGNTLWSSVFSTPAGQNAGRALAVDSSGNVVVAGWSDDGTGANYTDSRAIKYNGQTGAEIWNVSDTASTDQADFGESVAIDFNGDVIMTSVPLGYQRSVTGETLRTLKYSGASGAQIWLADQPVVPTATFVASGSWIPKQMVVDSAGNVIAVAIGTDGAQNFQTVKYNGVTGAVIWSNDFKQLNGGALPFGVAVDLSGNVFVTGESDKVGAVNTRTVKYNGVTGVQEWAVAEAGSVSSFPRASAFSIAVGSDGNPVITGRNFDPIAGITFLTVKYNGATGNSLWAVKHQGAVAGSVNFGYGVAIDKANNVLVTGLSTEVAGSTNMRTLKLSGASGATIWSAVSNGGSGGNNRGLAIATDSADSVVVTGFVASATAGSDIRTIKYASSNGAEIWSKTFSGSGTGNDVGYGVAVDSADDVVITGSSTDTVGGSNMRTIKYAGSTGNELWSVAQDSGATSSDVAHALAVDAKKNVWVVGYFSADANGNGRDIATIKYDGATGAALYSSTYAGSSGANDVGYAIATGPNGAVYVLGTARVTNQPIGLLLRKFQDLAVAQVASDLNGDGKSDLLLRDANGVINAYLMNGTSVSSATTLLASGSAWTVAHTGDFNGDGKVDLLFRKPGDGTVFAFLMDGLTVQTYTPLLGRGTPWVPVQVADFNGDGKADILWSNSDDGGHVIWLMNGTTIIGGGLIAAAGPWTVAQIGDFNGDGKADILWRNNTDGTAAIWLMDGTTILENRIVIGPSPWVATHTGDFNGDGKADILWRNSTDGSIVMWLMNGTNLSGGGTLMGASTWQVSHVGDLDGDGKADILFRNSSDGSVAGWLMNGAMVNSTGVATLLGPNSGYTIQKLLDFNGDGKADILWRGSNGSIVIWLMNGVSLIGADVLIGSGTFAAVPLP